MKSSPERLDWVKKRVVELAGPILRWFQREEEDQSAVFVIGGVEMGFEPEEIPESMLDDMRELAALALELATGEMSQ